MRSHRALTLLLLLAAASARAAVIQVPADYPTIQQAVDNASSGDQIHVSPGTYVEHVLVQGKAGLAISSQSGPAVTTVDGSGNGSPFSVINCDRITIQGFTMTHGLNGIHV